MSEEKKMPRRERERRMHREQILEAALELFSARGYHNVSMQEIAERAEYAIGTLYKFFPNKEEMYRALIREHADHFHEALNETLTRGNDELTTLRNYVATKGQVFSSHVPIIRLFLAESRGASVNVKGGLDEELRKRYDETLERLAKVIARGMKNGLFKNISTPFYLAMSIDSVINTFLMLSLEHPETHPFPENPDTILNMFFHGMLDS